MLKIVNDSFVKRFATTVLNAVLDITESEEKMYIEGPNNKTNEKDPKKSIDEKEVPILAALDR